MRVPEPKITTRAGLSDHQCTYTILPANNERCTLNILKNKLAKTSKSERQRFVKNDIRIFYVKVSVF